MKVGILINNAALFVNGSEQQPQFVIEMLQYMGINHVIYSHRGRENLCGMERSTKFNNTQLELIDDADLTDITTFIMICHIVEDTSELSNKLKERLRGKKVVQFHCGNHCLFNAEDIVFNKHNVVRLLFNTWFTEAWVFKMHFFARSYYELLTQKSCKLMPYPWSESLLTKYISENRLNIFCDNTKYNEKLLLTCFEPNLNVTKTCLCPLLIMNDFYKKHPERVEKCFIFCSKQLLDNRAFRDYLAFLKIAVDQKIEFYPRMAFPEILSQLKTKSLNPVFIGHQIYNDQNYLSLEALYLNYPIIHNSNSIRTAGFYYEEWDLHTAVTALEEVSTKFYEPVFFRSYKDRNNAVLRDHHPSNPTILNEFRALLQ